MRYSATEIPFDSEILHILCSNNTIGWLKGILKVYFKFSPHELKFQQEEILQKLFLKLFNFS